MVSSHSSQAQVILQVNSSKLTCDEEGAASRPGLVGDVTGVLAVALSVQSSDLVFSVSLLVAELSDGEEAGAQLPLVLQEASRVSSQQVTGEDERPTESLTNFCIHRLHHGRDCWTDREEMLQLDIYKRTGKRKRQVYVDKYFKFV